MPHFSVRLGVLYLRNVVSALAIVFVLPTVLALEPPAIAVEVPETPEWSTLLGPWAIARISTPVDGLEATGIVELTGATWTQRAYTTHRVGVYVDDRLIGNAQGTDSWTFSLDTRRLVDGAHTLTVRAFAAPTLTPSAVAMGGGESARFTSSNQANLAHVILYDEVVTFTGESTTRWVHRLQADHMGLRISITKEAGGLVEPRGQATVHYVDLDAAAAAKPQAIRSWQATYNDGGYYASTSSGAHDIITAPGLLMLNGHFTGEGKLRIRVEAIALNEAQSADARAVDAPTVIEAGSRAA